MSMTLSTIHQRKISNVPMAKHPGKFFNISATLWEVWERTLAVNYTGTQTLPRRSLIWKLKIFWDLKS